MPLELRGICPLLQVFDMRTSLAFYRDVLGFAVVASAPSGPGAAADDYGWVWLRHGETELMLNGAYETEAERPPVPDAARVTAHEDTTLFIGCPDVDGTWAYLRARGVDAPPPQTAPYGMRQLTVRDPDGFALCFQWPAEASAPPV